jgi:chromosome segregation ATPase
VRIRSSIALAVLFGVLLASTAFSQEPPAAPDLKPAGSEAARTAEQKNAEWVALASALELKVARLLPCDASVKSAIQEVSRASDVRFAAMEAYWRELQDRSKEQAKIARRLIEENDALVASWKNERADSEKAQARLENQALDLKESLRTIAALAPAARVLDGISRNSEALTSQSSERETQISELNAHWNEVIRAAQLRDASIENHVKAIAGERDRWSAYYAARIARGQVECSLTSSVSSAPRKPAPKASTSKTSK